MNDKIKTEILKPERKLTFKEEAEEDSIVSMRRDESRLLCLARQCKKVKIG